MVTLSAGGEGRRRGFALWERGIRADKALKSQKNVAPDTEAPNPRPLTSISLPIKVLSWESRGGGFPSTRIGKEPEGAGINTGSVSQMLNDLGQMT